MEKDLEKYTVEQLKGKVTYSVTERSCYMKIYSEEYHTEPKGFSREKLRKIFAKCNVKGDKNLKKLIWDKLNLVKSEQLVDLETFLLSLKLLSIFDSEAPNLEHALDSEAPMLTFKPAQNKPPEVGKVLNAFADLIPENSAQKNPMENLEMNKWTPSQDTNSNDTSMSFSESTKQRAPPTKPYNPFSELPVSDPQNLRVCLENWHAEFEVLKPETSGFYDDISKLKQMSKKYFLQKSEPTAQTRFDLVSDYSKNKTKEHVISILYLFSVDMPASLFPKTLPEYLKYYIDTKDESHLIDQMKQFAPTDRIKKTPEPIPVPPTEPVQPKVETKPTQTPPVVHPTVTSTPAPAPPAPIPPQDYTNDQMEVIVQDTIQSLTCLLKAIQKRKQAPPSTHSLGSNLHRLQSIVGQLSKLDLQEVRNTFSADLDGQKPVVQTNPFEDTKETRSSNLLEPVAINPFLSDKKDPIPKQPNDSTNPFESSIVAPQNITPQVGLLSPTKPQTPISSLDTMRQTELHQNRPSEISVENKPPQQTREQPRNLDQKRRLTIDTEGSRPVTPVKNQQQFFPGNPQRQTPQPQTPNSVKTPVLSQKPSNNMHQPNDKNSLQQDNIRKEQVERQGSSSSTQRGLERQLTEKKDSDQSSRQQENDTVSNKVNPSSKDKSAVGSNPSDEQHGSLHSSRDGESPLEKRSDRRKSHRTIVVSSSVNLQQSNSEVILQKTESEHNEGDLTRPKVFEKEHTDGREPETRSLLESQPVDEQLPGKAPEDEDEEIENNFDNDFFQENEGGQSRNEVDSVDMGQAGEEEHREAKVEGKSSKDRSNEGGNEENSEKSHSNVSEKGGPKSEESPRKSVDSRKSVSIPRIAPMEDSRLERRDSQREESPRQLQEVGEAGTKSNQENQDPIVVDQQAVPDAVPADNNGGGAGENPREVNQVVPDQQIQEPQREERKNPDEIQMLPIAREIGVVANGVNQQNNGQIEEGTGSKPDKNTMVKDLEDPQKHEKIRRNMKKKDPNKKGKIERQFDAIDPNWANKEDDGL